MLFVKTQTAPTAEKLTKEGAQEIYNRFEAGEDESIQFVKYNANPEHLEQVKQEFKRIESEANLIMSGRKVEKEATYDEEGMELTPIHYHSTPDTQEELTNIMSSTILDIAVVVDDVRRYFDGDPDKDPDFEAWKATFDEEVMV